MTIADILEVDGCRLVEPSFAELTTNSHTDLLLQMMADEARLLVDEDEELIAFALHDGSGWHAASFLFRDATLALIERFEEVGGDIYQEDRAAWLSAVREYYSLDISKAATPAFEDLSPGREEKIRDLIGKVWGGRPGPAALMLLVSLFRNPGPPGTGIILLTITSCAPRTRLSGRLAPPKPLSSRGNVPAIGPPPLGPSSWAGRYTLTPISAAIVADLLTLTDEC